MRLDNGKITNMTNEQIRIGVIGCAGRGGLARHAHRPQEGVNLVAAADISDQALKNFKERYGSDVFLTNDYRELLDRDDIDAVFICTPDWYHEEQAIAALSRGKGVYLEKPMAISIEGCDRILKCAQDNGAKLYLGHNMRHMKFTQKMKELIDEGAIGEVKAVWCRHFVGHGGDFYFKDWHSERKNVNSLLLQKGTHDIDVIHWLAGSYTQRVMAFGTLSVYDKNERRAEGEAPPPMFGAENWPPLKNKGMSPVIDVEDQNMVIMQLANGVQASYLQCHFTPDYWRNYTVIGTEGRIENTGEEKVCLWNRRAGAYTDAERTQREPDYKPYGDVQFDVTAPWDEHGGADPKIVDEFVHFLRGETRIKTSPIAARYSVAAGCLAADSLRAGGSLREMPELDNQLISYFEGA